MSSSDRRIVLAGLGATVLALPGCLRPMLAADTPAAGLKGRISFPETKERFQYFLNESLSARLGQPNRADFRLEVSKSITQSGVAIAQDSSITRITLVVSASWRLVSLRDGRLVLSDKLVVQSGYNATTSLYATRQVRRDIERRLAISLGERIARSIQARASELEA